MKIFNCLSSLVMIEAFNRKLVERENSDRKIKLIYKEEKSFITEILLQEAVKRKYIYH